MHVNAYNNVKHINNIIGSYYANKLSNRKYLFFKHVLAMCYQCLLIVIPFESFYILWYICIKCI